MYSKWIRRTIPPIHAIPNADIPYIGYKNDVFCLIIQIKAVILSAKGGNYDSKEVICL
jgi:uncharacterized membrane protein YkvA (DUF1232 family)